MKTVSKSEIETISKIAKRAVLCFPALDHMSTMMDIEFVHEKTPLRLQEFLNAGVGDFCHDITGIYRNFNRETKELENCFSPRYCK